MSDPINDSSQVEATPAQAQANAEAAATLAKLNKDLQVMGSDYTAENVIDKMTDLSTGMNTAQTDAATFKKSMEPYVHLDQTLKSTPGLQEHLNESVKDFYGQSGETPKGDQPGVQFDANSAQLNQLATQVRSLQESGAITDLRNKFGLTDEQESKVLLAVANSGGSLSVENAHKIMYADEILAQKVKEGVNEALKVNADLAGQHTINEASIPTPQLVDTSHMSPEELDKHETEMIERILSGG